MIVYAAVDILGGRAVQLVGGRVADTKVSWPDPLSTAQRWLDAGFRALHVVDLDGAFESGSNAEHIAQILELATVPVQVSGGVRDEDRIASLLEAGAARVVIGTRALEDDAWRQSVAQTFPQRLLVAADMRDGRVVKRGWTADAGRDAEEFIATLNDEPFAGVMVTDVSREGRMQGVNLDFYGRVTEISEHPIVAAGGIRDMADLRGLAAAGVAGAIIGMALYTGNIEPAAVLEEFAL
ncbi:MAG TPA: 1-(5-phosphoribosyl)-5-[(5-phosphoribosylamino)methylideneamino] imidazole-4-carboxamide isomerase [Woeseiaceae bacterium]